jgi:hypothetical protein
MFRDRLHSPDGDDLGEATYAMLIKPGEEILLGAGRRFRVVAVVPGEEILLGAGRRFRVVAVVPFEEEDESPFVGLLQVEAASSGGSFALSLEDWCYAEAGASSRTGKVADRSRARAWSGSIGTLRCCWSQSTSWAWLTTHTLSFSSSLPIAGRDTCASS